MRYHYWKTTNRNVIMRCGSLAEAKRKRSTSWLIITPKGKITKPENRYKMSLAVKRQTVIVRKEFSTRREAIEYAKLIAMSPVL